MTGGPVPVREDFGADPLAEMRAHYAAVQARMRAPRHVPDPVECRVVERPVLSADDLARMERERLTARVASEADRHFRAILQAADNVQIVASRFRTMARTVDTVTGISVEAMLGHRRTAYVVKARQILIWSFCHFLHASASQAGRRCGGRDHTTALHALRRVRSAMAANALVLPDDPAEAVKALWLAEWPKGGRP